MVETREEHLQNVINIATGQLEEIIFDHNNWVDVFPKDYKNNEPLCHCIKDIKAILRLLKRNSKCDEFTKPELGNNRVLKITMCKMCWYCWTDPTDKRVGECLANGEKSVEIEKAPPDWCPLPEWEEK